MIKKMYLSGYTRKSNKGISIVDIDFSGDIPEVISQNLVEEENPSYIALSKDKNLLFSVTSKNGGGVTLYKKSANSYELVDSVGNLGKAPCHLYFDEKLSLLYSSNYHLGRLDILKVENDGNNVSLKLINQIKFENKSVVSPNQDSSKCHMAIKDRDDKFMIVIDLGGDIVYTYSVDESGEVKLENEYVTNSGMGPRHIEFSKCGEFAYLLGELDSNIDVLKYNKDTGYFSLIERISMLPEDYSGENSGAAIKISRNGKYLYSSNRGHDSIAIYDVMGDGTLSLKGIKSTGGKTPRDFGFDSDEKFLFVGHQDGEEITVFKIDEETGLPNILEDFTLKIPEITCVVN